MLKINSKKIVGLLMAFAFVFAASANALTTTSAAKITKSSSKADVMWIQEALNTFVGTTLAVDGKYGPKTTAAIKAFQVANPSSGIADGIAGKKTLAALNARVAGGVVVNNPNTPSNSTGPLSVSLSNDNPAVGTVLSGQALADLAHFTFSGNGTLTQVTLQRTGLSTSADISNVYLFDGNMRLTDGASVNTNGQIVFSGLNIAVNGSKTLSVKADLVNGPSQTPAGTFSSVSLGVTLTGYMVAGSTTANTANVAGNVMYASTAPSNSASATLNSQTVSSANINAGATGYTVWSAPIQISGRNVMFKGANFRVVGSAPSDALANIKMYVDGTQVGSATTVNSNGYAFFDMGTGTTLTTGSHTLDVRADVVKGSNRTFQFSIQNGADLMVSDSQLGINIAVSSATTNGSAGTISILSGSVTVNVDPTFQSMTNITGGATNTVIGKFKLHGYGEDVKVQTLYVLPAVTNGLANGASSTSLNNVTLFFNGSQVGSSKNFNGSTLLTYTLGSSLIVPAGVDSTLEVRADLQNDSNYNYTAGSVVTTLVGGSTINNGQGMTSLDSTLDIPSAGNGTTTGVSTSGLTVQTGALSVSKNTGYADYTLNPNATGAKIGSFLLQNQSTSESVRVTNLAVNLAYTTVGSTNYSNLKTSETSGSGSTPINPATASAGSNATDNFSVNFELAPGSTKTIDIFADLGTTATGATVIVSLKPTAIGASSNVTLTPASQTTGQTITLSSGTFGTPTFTSSSSTVAQYIAANGGATDAVKQTYKFSATSGTATVSEAKFVVKGAGTAGSIRIGTNSASFATPPATTLGAAITTTTATTVTVASTSNISVGSVITVGSEDMLVSAVPTSSTLTVTRGVNSTSAATASNGATVTINGMAYMTGLSLSVPNGGAGSQVDAYVTYNHVGTNGVTSSTTSQVEMTYVKYLIGGTSTATSLTPVAGNTYTLVGSKPTVTASKPTATLAAAATEAIDVTVAADAKGDITLNAFPITVALNGATVSTSSTSNISMQTSDGQTVTVTSTAFSATTGGSSTVSITNGYLIPAGTSKTFRVFVTPATVTGTGVNGASMTTSLATGSAFSWTDTAGAAGSAATGTANIYNFPNTFSSTIYN